MNVFQGGGVSYNPTKKNKETKTVCHEFLNDPRFYSFLLQIDHDIANQVRQNHCFYCTSLLHSADYPRKPRGPRGVMTDNDRFCRMATGLQRRGKKDGCTIELPIKLPFHGLT